jgi:hypothetical protein
MPRCLYQLGPGRTRGTCALSEPTHFRPKSKAEMGARGRIRTALSVWVVPLGRVLYPCGHMLSIWVGPLDIRLDRRAAECLNWPAGMVGDALRSALMLLRRSQGRQSWAVQYTMTPLGLRMCIISRSFTELPFFFFAKLWNGQRCTLQSKLPGSIVDLSGFSLPLSSSTMYLTVRKCNSKIKTVYEYHLE